MIDTSATKGKQSEAVELLIGESGGMAQVFGGEFVDGKPHGVGVKSWPDGERCADIYIYGCSCDVCNIPENTCCVWCCVYLMFNWWWDA